MPMKFIILVYLGYLNIYMQIWCIKVVYIQNKIIELFTENILYHFYIKVFLEHLNRSEHQTVLLFFIHYFLFSFSFTLITITSILW